jgi:nucleoid-associated protein YgaU
MLSSVTTIRNLFILLAALALATGCTTAKTLGTPVSAVAATPATSSDTGAAETTEAASSDTGTAEAVETTTDTGTAEAASSDTGTAEAASSDTGTAEAASSDTGTAEAASSDTGTAEAASSDTGVAETTEAASSDTGTAEAVEATTDTGTAEVAEAAAPKPWTPYQLKLWTVDEGEHLWGISAHNMVYGDPYQWPLLFKRNRHQIEDADLIYPGQVLHIERDLSDAEIDRAIEHAKTRGAWILGITELTDLEFLSRERAYE